MMLQNQQMSQSFLVTNSKSSTIEGLKILQDELKREYLLLQREQREKVKIKKQIQSTIQDYYSVLVEKKGLGKVITDDKLSNSYNFVKDLVINISKDVKLGFQVLLLCKEETANYICPLLIAMFYENLAENDPYVKKNTRFAELLGMKISQQLAQSDQNFLKKANQKTLSKNKISPIVLTILKQFCKLQSIKQYFQMLANRILNKIPQSIRNATGRSSLQGHQYEGVTITELNQSTSFNRSNSNINFQSFQHEHQIQNKIKEAVEDYKADIISKAEMIPISLRVLIYKIVSQMEKLKTFPLPIIHQFIWQLLQVEYFRPFDNSNPKKWNHFQNSYFSETVNKICETMRKKIDEPFRSKLIQKIINISKEKVNRKEEDMKKGIVINGGCVSYMNLYYLFKVIKQNQKSLKPLNERVINRVNKINQMNPNFEFFKDFNNPSTSYLVFFELVYGETLQKDYQGMYISIYNQNKAKDMLKQILSDTTFHILPYIQRQHSLKQILKKVIQQQQMQGEGNFFLGALQYSSQFIMKVKYLVYLMEREKQNKINEVDLFSEMIKQCLERQKKNLVLFKKNKIQLLQCLTNVSKSKKTVKNQKQSEKNVESHLKIVKILDTMQINICITGPSTRPEKDKYLKTENQGITIQNAATCPHQQNIEQGLKHHANNVQQALSLFCELKQVRSTIETGKDINKVNESLLYLTDHLKNCCKTGYFMNLEDFAYFQSSISKVIMRQLHQILIDNRQKTHSEIEFQKKLKDLSFIRPNKIKIAGRDNLSELEQVWEIACRYLKVLNQKKNPVQKIEVMVEMIEVIKISIRKDKFQKQKQDNSDKTSVQIVIAYCLIRSRPEKILFNINFMQVFMPKDKLMSKQGAVLQRLKNAVALIQKNKITQYLILEEPQFQEQLFKSYTANSVQDMKQNQKAKGLAYI